MVKSGLVIIAILFPADNFADGKSRFIPCEPIHEHILFCAQSNSKYLMDGYLAGGEKAWLAMYSDDENGLYSAYLTRKTLIPSGNLSAYAKSEKRGVLEKLKEWEKVIESYENKLKEKSW